MFYNLLLSNTHTHGLMKSLCAQLTQCSGGEPTSLQPSVHTPYNLAQMGLELAILWFPSPIGLSHCRPTYIYIYMNVLYLLNSHWFHIKSVSTTDTR